MGFYAASAGLSSPDKNGAVVVLCLYAIFGLRGGWSGGSVVTGVGRLLRRMRTLGTTGTRRLRTLHVGCLDGGKTVGSLVTSFHGMTTRRGGRINVHLGRLGGGTRRGVTTLGRRFRDRSANYSSVSLAHSTCPVRLKAHRPLSVIEGRVVSVFTHVKFGVTSKPRVRSS